jgi:hypothetical protein
MPSLARRRMNVTPRIRDPIKRDLMRRRFDCVSLVAFHKAEFAL